jgi:hypothetical protein
MIAIKTTHVPSRARKASALSLDIKSVLYYAQMGQFAGNDRHDPKPDLGLSNYCYPKSR